MNSRKFRQVSWSSLPLVAALAIVAGCGGKPPAPKVELHTVEKGDLSIAVIESGTIDASKSVEIKSGVTGRLTQLLVAEGENVKAGQLLAVVDPQETKLRVEQDQAQLQGAESAVDRATIEIEQRRITAKATYEQSKARVAQLELESQAQPELTKSAIAQAESAVTNAKLERERLLTSSQPTQRASSQATLDEAQTNLTNAKRDYDRQADLERKGFVSTRVLDSARQALETAQARVRSAAEQVSRQEAQFKAEVERADQLIRQAQTDLTRAKTNAYLVPSKREELISARADLDKSRAALRDAEALVAGRRQSQATVAQLRSALGNSVRQLKETTVRSPIDGVVIKKYLNLGELASGLSSFSAGTAIYKIEDRSTMRVKLFVNEIDVARLKLGMEAKVDVDAFPNKNFTGKVTKIAPASKEAGAVASAGQSTDTVVKYEVEVTLTNSQNELRSGMSAKVFVSIQSRSDVVVVPLEFVTKDGKDYYVDFAPATPTDKPVHKQVTVGLVTGSKIEVLEGVKVGDKLAKPEFTGPKRKGFMQMGPDQEENVPKKKEEKSMPKSDKGGATNSAPAGGSK